MYIKGSSSSAFRNPTGKNQRGKMLPDSSFMMNPFTLARGPSFNVLKAHSPSRAAKIQLMR